MNKDEIKIIDEFSSIHPFLKDWGQFVDKQLLEILDEDFVQTNLLKISPEHRIKDSLSYLYKALYRNKNYSNPLKDIEDKIGTRLIFLKSDDIKKASEKILAYKGWNSKMTKDLYGEIDDKPTIFDYQSVHLVVTPNSGSKYDEALVPFLSCEIQLRTLLQHAFAEISHDSTYKGPYKNDREILRHMAKSMALMEATDDYFLDIFKMMGNQERYYANYINQLIALFQNYDSTFSREKLQFDLSDNILGLLTQKEIGITEIEAFTSKKDKELKGVINSNNGMIFNQPISLLIAYYFFHHKSFLRENWPLSEEALRKVYQAFGVSYDSY